MTTILLGLALSATPVGLAHDFGTVRTGPALVHEFAVTNPGPDPLTLTGVTTPCDCMTVAFTPTTLAAGATAKLPVRVNTLAAARGPQTWRGVVRTAAGTEIPWQLRATVIEGVSLTPPALAVTLSGSRPVTVPVRLAAADGRPLTVRGVTASSPAVTPRAEGTTVHVAIDPTRLTGSTAARVVIYTDRPDCPELELPVTLKKSQTLPVEMSPESCDFVLSATETTATRLVQLRATTAAPLKLAGLTTESPELKLAGATAGRLMTVKVTLTVPATETAGQGVARVILADPPGQLELPVTWTRR